MFADSLEIIKAIKYGGEKPKSFKRLYIYVSVVVNMFPSVAFIILNTPNDFIDDFNRYPESFETVSIAQYRRDSVEGQKRDRSRRSESLEVANARISDEEMFQRVAGTVISTVSEATRP